MQKTIVLPIVTTIFIVIQALFNIQVEQSVIDETANAVSILLATVITIWGIVKNHKKKEEK